MISKFPNLREFNWSIMHFWYEEKMLQIYRLYEIARRYKVTQLFLKSRMYLTYRVSLAQQCDVTHFHCLSIIYLAAHLLTISSYSFSFSRRQHQSSEQFQNLEKSDTDYPSTVMLKLMFNDPQDENKLEQAYSTKAYAGPSGWQKVLKRCWYIWRVEGVLYTFSNARWAKPNGLSHGYHPISKFQEADIPHIEKNCCTIYSPISYASRSSACRKSIK